MKEIFAIVNQIKQSLHSLEKKSTRMCFSSFFQQRRLLTYRIRSNFFGKVRFHANNNIFLFYIFF